MLMGKKKSNLMLLGGSWCKDLDQGDPLQVSVTTKLFLFVEILIIIAAMILRIEAVWKAPLDEQYLRNPC
jgi:hypothetical protein